MPSALTFPGVYIEEIPSGVRTITGVSTSNTAFVDFFAARAAEQGGADHELRGVRAHLRRPAPATARPATRSQQYYLNGGSVAFVVRVAGGDPGKAQLDAAKAAPRRRTPWSSGPSSRRARGPTTQSRSPSCRRGDRVQPVRPRARRSTRTATSSWRPAGRRVLRVRGLPQSQRWTTTSPATSVGRRLTESLLVEADRPDGPRRPAQRLGRRPDAGGPADEADWPTPTGGSARRRRRTATSRPPSAELLGSRAERSPGMYALERIAPYIFNILCLPARPNLDERQPGQPSYDEALAYCIERAGVPDRRHPRRRSTRPTTMDGSSSAS